MKTNLFDILARHTNDIHNPCLRENVDEVWKSYLAQIQSGIRTQSNGKVMANRYFIAGLLAMSLELRQELLTGEQNIQFEDILNDASIRIGEKSTIKPVEARLRAAMEQSVPDDPPEDADRIF